MPPNCNTLNDLCDLTLSLIPKKDPIIISDKLIAKIANIVRFIALESSSIFDYIISKNLDNKYSQKINNLISYVSNANEKIQYKFKQKLNLFKKGQFYGITLMERLQLLNLDKDNINFIKNSITKHKKMGIIVFTYPACGKTFLANQHTNCIDLVCSADKYILTKQQKKLSKEWLKGTKRKLNPNFEKDYLMHLKQSISNYDFIFVPISGIKVALRHGLNYFWCVYPTIDSKTEFENRMKNRGNNPIFISKYIDNWDKEVNYEYEKSAYKSFRINKTQYLEDVLKPYLSNSI